MGGRIFNCHHLVPPRIQANALFATLVSGVASDPATGLLGDLDGPNIARPNLHSEMRHQWHVWRHRLDGLDWVGFEHYRRVFFVQPFGARLMGLYDRRLGDVARAFASALGHVGDGLDDATFHRYLDLRELCTEAMARILDRLMERHEVVLQRWHDQRIDEQWRACHPPAEWDLLTDAVRATGFFRDADGLIDFELRGVSFCSMHLMRADTFRDYMAFWTECMAYLEPRVEHRERYFGYFSERLLNLYVNGRRLRDPAFATGALPFVIHL